LPRQAVLEVVIKKIILKWKEQRQYKKYISDKIPLNKKVINIIISLFLNSIIWILVWVIAKINPNKNPIEFYYMLPLALGAGIVFTILYKLAGLLKDRISFSDSKIYYFCGGMGINIKYKNILSYSILTINQGNHIFKLLIFKYNEKIKNKEKYVIIEINENINLKLINSIFAANNIKSDEQLNESEYVNRKVLRYFNTSGIA
jgi:hypothetical protein